MYISIFNSVITGNELEGVKLEKYFWKFRNEWKI